MQLTTVFGHGGTGKTNLLLEEAKMFAEKEKRITWLIVPDTSTFVMEKRVLDTLGDQSGSYVQVFSLNRLAFHILSETGGMKRPFLDAMGKSILVYRIVRKLQDKLPLFSDAIRRGGFAKAASDIIAELKRYAVTAEELKLVAKRITEPRLLPKIQEIAMIYQTYQELMVEKGYRDIDDRLQAASEVISLIPGITNIHLVIDQFHKFSPAQIEFVKMLFYHVSSMSISFRTQENRNSENGQGSLSKHGTKILESVLSFAKEKGSVIINKQLPDKDFRHLFSPELEHLSRYMHTKTNKLFLKKPQSVFLQTVRSPDDEIHQCARNIIFLTRDKGVRLKDIAVLIPDVSDYMDHIQTIFGKYQLPCFSDHTESLAGNPVTVAMLAAFDILRGGWRHDDMFRLLKTGLLKIPMDSIDDFENEALRLGFRGKKQWCHSIFIHEEHEFIRQTIVIPLLEFRRTVYGPVTMRTALESYVTLLLAWEIPQTISSLSKSLQEAGMLAEAGHMKQIWQSACDMMDQMMELSGDNPVTLTDLHGMLQTGLESGETLVIPPSVEEVFIGNPARSRMSEIRHLFVLGAVDGWIPANPRTQSLLSDQERSHLLSYGIELAPETIDMIIEQQHELDIVLSMPSEGLWISRPVSDSEGKSLVPSTVIKDIKQLFPALSESGTTHSGEFYPEMSWITTPLATLETLVPKLSNQQMNKNRPEQMSFLSEIFHSLFHYPETHNDYHMILEGLTWENQSFLEPEWIKNRYQSYIAGSISSLELYRQCPFAWYARYAAKLKERDEIGLADIGFGNLMHDAMNEIFTSVDALGGWDLIEEEQLVKTVSEAVEKSVLKGTGISPLHPGLYNWFKSRLKQATHIAGKRVLHQIQTGDFRPVGHEISFGREGMFPPYYIELPDGHMMHLEGRLDRLDTCRLGNELFLRVIDYKSGSKEVSLSDIFYGLSLQLPLYLSVALAHIKEMNHIEAKPAGIFHMRLEPPDIRSNDRSIVNAEDERNKRMRLTGVLLDNKEVMIAMDHGLNNGRTSQVINAKLKKDGSVSSSTVSLSEKGFTNLGSHLQKLLTETGSCMKNGDISVFPVSTSSMKACDYCSYLRVCRFEPGIGKNSWNKKQNISDKNVKQALGCEE